MRNSWPRITCATSRMRRITATRLWSASTRCTSPPGIIRATSRQSATMGTAHGWCAIDSQVYNMGEAEKAWAKLLDMYKTL